MSELFDLLFSCGLPLFLIGLGFGIGAITERRHLTQLAQREAAAQGIAITNLKTCYGVDADSTGEMVVGECVIATDYFKTFVAGLIKIIGGELKTYRTLMERARREALLRLMENAAELGYDAVCNVRLIPADIGGSAMDRKGRVMVAIIASGTAYSREDSGAQQTPTGA